MKGVPALLIDRTFAASRERVFDAFTSEEVMRRWWHADKDWLTPTAEVDLRVGGAIRVVMRDPHTGAEYGGGGVLTEIERPSRLAFTWIWDDEPHGTLIEMDFEEGDGETTMRFKHSHLWSDETVRSHEEGWTGAFDNLERELAG